MDPRITLRLARVSKRLRSVRTGWSLAGLWLLAAACGWLLLIVFRSGLAGFSNPLVGPTAQRDFLVTAWLATAVAFGLVLVVLIRFGRPNYARVVHRIEDHFPSLEQRLLTASQITSSSTLRPMGYLQRCVVSEAIRHDLKHDWCSLISSGRLLAAWTVQALALAFLLFTAWLVRTTPEKVHAGPALAAVIDLEASDAPDVEPGNAEIERGSSLIITAHFDHKFPDEVWLVQAAAASSGSEAISRVRMRSSLDDPIFGAYLAGVSQPFDYHIEYGSRVSPGYHVQVYDVPALIRADAELVYPTYASQSERSVLDTRRITVPAGTQVTWKLQINKPVAIAELIGADGAVSALMPAEDSPTTVETTLVLQESQRWLVRLVDAQDRSNAGEIKLQANVLPNESAKIQLLAGGDARLSPLEEFDVSVKVSDDHAITAAGLAYQFGGGEMVEINLDTTASGIAAVGASATVDDPAQQLSGEQRQVSFSQRIDLESLAALPNQLLSYYVWAEDVGPDGQPRRALSDIYFAEVRPFEEIFREGQQPTSDEQQQQPQAGDPQTEELVELQKQIVVATWNLLRDHRNSMLPQTASADLDLLIESQENAAELLVEKAADIQDAQLLTHVQQASQAMRWAIDRLADAGQTLARAELETGLSHEQAAYQALLQLQSQEHQVVRGQRSQSQSASSSSAARQAQIEQLSLSNDENRYENERLAQSQEQEQQSEMRQINSRLRELAARQQDLNQQVRELQAALQAAQTVAEHQEIEQRLQRLREQQQQMLAESDELNERLQNPADPSMQEAQQAMQQARDSMQRANEALQQDKPGEALAAGARAEQQMRELQETLRQQSSNQFQQALQEMQQQAADMETTQNQLSQQLRSPSGSDPDTFSQPASGRPAAEESALEESAAEQSAAEGPSDGAAESDVYHTSSATRPAVGLRGQEPNQQAVADALRQQQANLQELLQRMEQTVNEAEATEPLLAQRLYDSYRRLQQNKTLERMQVTQQLVERNLQQPAGELAQTSAEELSELREQIDHAAQAVVGSDVESLRLALNKLETLAEELESEFPAAASGALQDSSQPEALQKDAPPPNPSAQDLSQAEPADQPPPASQSRASDGQPRPQPQAGQEPQEAQGAQTAQGARSLRGGQTRSADVQSSGQPGEQQQPNAGGPLSGDGFRSWSDTLRDVEELVGDAELRWQATEIRQSARELRSGLKKHAAEPQWEAVQELVAAPLRELKHQVADELMRRAADKTQIVPLDRDPVPSEFKRSVQQYFENLGSGQ